MDFNIQNSYYQKDLLAVANLDFIPWKKMENKSILITGATGLIGSFLVDLLMFRNEHYGDNITIYALNRSAFTAAKRFSVYLDKPLFHAIQQDIAEKIELSYKADFIIHGASNAYPAVFATDPVGTMKSNLWGMANLLDYSLKVKSERVLYISSGEVYGEGNGKDFVENYSGYVDCLNPRSCYPSSKRAAETLCSSYFAQFDVNIVVVRPCHIYGPTFSESDNRAFAQFVRKVLNNNDVVLKSTGEQYRSYCYVADCVSALLVVLLDGEKGNVYNIANKQSNVTIAELAQTIASARGQKVVFDLPSDEEKKGYSVVTKAILCADKLEKLGWKPKYNLSDGIQKSIQILQSMYVNY